MLNVEGGGIEDGDDDVDSDDYNGDGGHDCGDMVIVMVMWW